MSIQKARQITMYICTTVMIVLGIYDLIIVNTHGPDASISRFIQISLFNSPIFSFGLGTLFGHFAMYFRPKWKNPEALIEEMSKRLIDDGKIIYNKTSKKYCCNKSGLPLKGQE